MSERKTKLSRRDFLRIVAVAGGAGTLLKFGLDAINAPIIASESRILMGTVVNLTLIGEDREYAKAAIANVLEGMEALEAVFSRFRSQSEVSQLNRTGRLYGPSQALFDVLARAQEFSQLTDGAFDVTVKPLVDLYQKCWDDGQGLPAEQEITGKLSLVGYEKLNVSRQGVRFERQGMGITLDGIAKGYIVDRGVSILRELGFSNVMVEAGGDLLASGEKGDHSPWRIGIRSPRPTTPDLLAKIDISNRALATSGDYMQPFSTDKLHHHIIDPRVGHSSPFLASATAIAPSCMMADALATALMVMDLERGMSLVNSLDDVDAYVVTKKMEVISTF